MTPSPDKGPDCKNAEILFGQIEAWCEGIFSSRFSSLYELMQAISIGFLSSALLPPPILFTTTKFLFGYREKKHITVVEQPRNTKIQVAVFHIRIEDHTGARQRTKTYYDRISANLFIWNFMPV